MYKAGLELGITPVSCEILSYLRSEIEVVPPPERKPTKWAAQQAAAEAAEEAQAAADAAADAEAQAYFRAQAAGGGAVEVLELTEAQSDVDDELDDRELRRRLAEITAPLPGVVRTGEDDDEEEDWAEVRRGFKERRR